MQRALTSGVSGMINNQLVMENTANNLANVNTTGFKSSRVSFATALVQTSYSGSGAGSSTGGRNPIQTGLGMTSNSVDVDMRQGSIQSTGRNLDLAVQGEGFFEVSNGTTSSFTRVGNFAFDSSDNLVSAGTGYRLIGNTYNTRPNPDGSQSITQIGVPLQIDRSAAFPPKQTEEVTFNGNLSPTTRALRGFTLTSTFPMVNTLTGKVATEDTKLSDLNIFKDIPGTPGSTITMNVFGTKPDGSAYGAQFDLHPWDTPTIANNQIGSVSELILKLGNALSQGSDRFGSVRLDNGNLLAAGIGNGENFSMFLGEGTSAFGGANPPIPGLAGSPAYTGTPVTATTHTMAASESGLLDPAFVIPASDFSAQPGTTLRIALSVNGIERGSVTIPAGNYSASSLADRTFHLPSFPQAKAGDVVTIGLSGALNVGTVTYTTTGIRDSDPLNKTADSDGNGKADMFQDGSAVDPNAWVYENGTNSTFDWYRARVVPETVASSIDVFDAQGGKHTLATRFFRTGSRTDSATGAIYNSWDMMVNTPGTEGTMINSVVAGIEFDQNGRFTGSVGTSVRGTAYTDAGYAGNPGAGSIQINWNSTGPTDPTSIAMDFGAANSVSGLTGFGGNSTATAVVQDGYPDGRLDTITMSAEGDLMGMYTNGVTLKLAQVQLATFRNPAGLLSSGGSMFVESANSGSATRRTAGQGAGFITAGALEGGNVDIATEFTRIITAQRGFQVNARVIQTTDSLLEELANLIR